MNSRIFLLFAIFFPSTIFCQNFVRAVDKTDADIYPWITFLSENESQFESENQTSVECFRVVITTSEIYNSLYIEKVIMGEEGGGKKIAWRRMLNEDDMRIHLELKGEFAGIQFIAWTGNDSFKFSMHGRTFEVSQLNGQLYQILELTL
jgi:hypothetical protein